MTSPIRVPHDQSFEDSRNARLQGSSFFQVCLEKYFNVTLREKIRIKRKKVLDIGSSIHIGEKGSYWENCSTLDETLFLFFLKMVNFI